MHVDPLADTLKVVQVGFYIIAAAIAILTYLAAKRGLLNTVNTEYQKRVMDRLQKLSEDLYSEFDPSAPTYWAENQSLLKAAKWITEDYERTKDAGVDLSSEKDFPFHVPLCDDIERLMRLLGPIGSDPFIPEVIREAVVEHLGKRIGMMGGIYFEELRSYGRGLAAGKRKPIKEHEDIIGLSSAVVGKLYAKGCGVSQIEKEVHYIRKFIQHYFDCFNPHWSQWWHGRPVAPTPPKETREEEGHGK